MQSWSVTKPSKEAHSTQPAWMGGKVSTAQLYPRTQRLQECKVHCWVGDKGTTRLEVYVMMVTSGYFALIPEVCNKRPGNDIRSSYLALPPGYLPCQSQ